MHLCIYTTVFILSSRQCQAISEFKGGFWCSWWSARLSDASTTYDVAIIGGGIVGLATAMALSRAGSDRAADFRLVVVETEGRLAQHQTGHNSGVIHSGLYYKPGSLKARLCTSGRESLYAFCKEHGVTHDPCGKLVVATDEKEVATLEMLAGRGEANGLDGMKWLNPTEIARAERFRGGRFVGATNWHC